MNTMKIIAVALALCTSAATVQAQEPRRVQGFSVLLLVGETQSAAAPLENISAPARQGARRHQGLPAVQELSGARYCVDRWK
jgi:hypothetical protein